MDRTDLSRRTFLRKATLSVCLAATPSPTVVEAVASDTRTFPLLRWSSADEVRRQPEEVWRLVDLINAFRRANRLPEAALSPRLTVVALEHVRDLIHNRPHETTGNLHNWSHGAHWTGGVYRPDEKATWPIMWDKPREIAGYEGYGFEIAASNVDSSAHALQAWRGSRAHLEVILSRGVWNKPRWRWKALGAVFYKGYASAWFGADEDVF